MGDQGHVARGQSHEASRRLSPEVWQLFQTEQAVAKPPLETWDSTAPNRLSLDGLDLLPGKLDQTELVFDRARDRHVNGGSHRRSLPDDVLVPGPPVLKFHEVTVLFLGSFTRSGAISFATIVATLSS